LFALVAGKLAHVHDTFKTFSGRVIDLFVYVEPGDTDKCAHALESLKHAMRWDEKHFGREYDLDCFMIVAVNDFNMGAMENKGLNIFNAKCVLARPDTATDQNYIAIESIIAHEYFHNWTGNRVTCRDWFQLSLKEGLTVFRDQSFSCDMHDSHVTRIEQVKTLMREQFPEDAGHMAHPVRPASYEEINNFYTATIYDKGAEVIRMQQILLGVDGFRRGMDLYFNRHDGQAVTIDDFVAAMEDANGIDLTQFKRWYSQAGTPVVTVKTEYHAGRLTVSMTQTCSPTNDCVEKEPFHIPIQIALFSARGEELPCHTPLLILRDNDATFHLEGFTEEPIVSLLRGFSAPVILRSNHSTDELLVILHAETDGFAKWHALQQVVLATMRECYQTPRDTWQIPTILIETYRRLLTDETISLSLRAELLTLPDFEAFANLLTDVDVAILESVRDFFKKTIGLALFEPFLNTYNQLLQQENHAMDARAFSRRQLRQVCFFFMMKADEKRALPLAEAQFMSAKTMSDQQAAFALLMDVSDSASVKAAVESFYQQWHHDPLVLDKWFMLQAASERSDTLPVVKNLCNHSDFSIKNPNKVRALIGSFSRNPRHFHAIDGSGYAFLANFLRQLDLINPQISARLCTPFTHIQQFDSARQQLMKAQLLMLQQLDLSKNLREIVTKCLAD
jgi:aminopeptidase N